VKSTIPVSLARACDIQKPATTGLYSKDYVAVSRNGVSLLPKSEHGKARTALNIFERWVVESSELRVDEALFVAWQDDIVSGRFRKQNGEKYSSATKKMVGLLMRLHNACVNGEPRFLRELIDLRSYSRLSRFLSLTPVTQKAMLWYESSGCRPPKTNGQRRLQSVRTRIGAIHEALLFLDRICSNGLEEISSEMAQKYLGHPDENDEEYRRRYRSLHNLNALVQSCCNEGLLPSNFLGKVAGNQIFASYAQRDFLPPDEQKKLLDLQSVDMDDDRIIRDRLLCLLFLDLALRRGELASLQVDQVREIDGSFAFSLLPENQKMTGKPRTEMPLYYNQTGELLKKFLESRIEGGSLALFQNCRGGRLSGESMAKAVKRECSRVGVGCYYKQQAPPSPHDLRRTFGMVNCEGIGLDLGIHAIAERLRDTVAVAERHYSTNNPLLASLKAKEYRRRGNGQTVSRNEIHQCIEKLRIFGFSDSLLAQNQAEIDRIEKPETTEGSTREPVWVPESDALARLRTAWDGLPSKRALRSYLGGNRLSTRQHLPKGRLAIDDCWVSEMVEGFDAVTNLPKGKTISSRIRQRIKRELTGLIEIGSFILVKSGDAAAAMRIILGDE
jgi:integrase